jgi:hypothetical protein
VYFREMSGLGVMSPEEELSIATRIAQLRREYWTALCWPTRRSSSRSPISSRQKLEAEDVPRPEVEAMRPPRATCVTARPACPQAGVRRRGAALVERMAEVDVDGIVSDVLLGDLEQLDDGRARG